MHSCGQKQEKIEKYCLSLFACAHKLLYFQHIFVYDDVLLNIGMNNYTVVLHSVTTLIFQRLYINIYMYSIYRLLVMYQWLFLLLSFL